MNGNRQTAIRGALLRLGPGATVDQVVEEVRRYGVEVSRRLVTQVQGQMLRSEAQAAREQSKTPPATRSHRRPQQRKIPRRRG